MSNQISEAIALQSYELVCEVGEIDLLIYRKTPFVWIHVPRFCRLEIVRPKYRLRSERPYFERRNRNPVAVANEQLAAALLVKDIRE